MDIQTDINIKKLFHDKIITINDNKLDLDIEEFIKYDYKLYENFLSKPVDFISRIKTESKVYNLENPLVNFTNWKENKDISKIRVKDIGKIVQLDGMISKTTDPLALVISKTFTCPSCGSILKTEGKNPKGCSCGRKSNFIPEDTQLQDIQELVLEELQERTEGKTPQKIRIRLVDELTDTSFSQLLRPGNRVSIIGYIDKILLNNKNDEEIFHYRITAVQIMDLEDRFDDTIKPEDMDDIREISLNNPIEKLTNSIAPNIWGRDELKKTLLLQLVGGVKKEMNDGKLTRDWINILVVGSPSTSKTELAKNINIRCPKSFYASGDNASGVGLTVAMTKDELLGNWGIEVGPLVKANGSILVCDELDKFPKDQLKALHTPLESGIVKLSKAGVDGKFPAETGLLGLANPKNGVFEENKSIIDQVNLPPALLSRFDLIHILKDEIDEESDNKITEIIYSQKNGNDEPPIPVQLFRKYVTYAKEFKPKLLEEHLLDLQKFYHDVRKKSISEDSNMRGLPIGTRHLQGLIRLAEASAKLRLSETVEKEDFELVKKLFYDSLVKIGMDEGGVFDLARMSNSKQTVSKRKKTDFVMEVIRILYSEWGSVKDYELFKVLEEKGMSNDESERIIDDLNRDGYILKNGNEWKIV